MVKPSILRIGLSFCLACFVFACTQPSDPVQQNPTVFAIDLTNGYQADTVEVTFDNVRIFSDVVTTDLLHELAKRITFSPGRGVHRIQVGVLNRQAFADTMIVIPDTLNVRVSYYEPNNRIYVNTYPFWYPEDLRAGD